MNFIDRKKVLRKHLDSKIRKGIENREIILEFLTNQLMLSEFKNFQNHHGLNMRNFPSRALFVGFTSGLKYFIRGSSVTLYALLLTLFRDRNKRYSGVSPEALIYALPIELIRPIKNIELENFFDSQLLKLGFQPPNYYLVQLRSNIRKNKKSRIIFERHIGSALLIYSHKSKLKVLSKLIRNYIQWIILCISDPEMLTIGSEFIVDTLSFNEYSNLKLKYLITTQSTMLCLPTAFNFLDTPKKMMFWYSDNSRNIMPISSGKEVEFDYSYLTESVIDFHIVWTNSWAQILKKYTIGECVVNGPVLFKNLELIDSRHVQKNEKMKILVFDVTPQNSFENSEHAYNLCNSVNFIDDIIEVAKQVSDKIEVHLKPKRKYTSAHSNSYIKYLSSRKNELTILSTNQDLANLIMNYDLVISIPFTSTSILAKYLKKGAIFYFPNIKYQLVKTYEDIAMVIGKEELRDTLNQYFNHYNKAN